MNDIFISYASGDRAVAHKLADAFRKLGHEQGMEQITWRLHDSDGTEIFDSRLYTEPGTQVLRTGGTYTLSVGSDRVPATGTYSLQLSNAPDR